MWLEDTCDTSSVVLLAPFSRNSLGVWMGLGPLTCVDVVPALYNIVYRNSVAVSICWSTKQYSITVIWFPIRGTNMAMVVAGCNRSRWT